ncbi:helix-turn-helix domain-containing protein [Domibacillus iocasae]|uniref:HTH araC/xylS-type domain-containing protein n=1 Tax=Domibacillus iocasae TaxID=1714016 RepID=A0A1E7DUA3_9BACI|nr:AraC family transcriptional regulator [Domibacillus iocasae]OES46667.1 hypothetical protein BA724_01000 [Domibacillus iocasae]
MGNVYRFEKETISQAIQRARVEEAESWLLLSSHPIAVISAWLLFTGQSHFTKIFKKHTGLTPKQYRQSIHISRLAFLYFHLKCRKNRIEMYFVFEKTLK